MKNADQQISWLKAWRINRHMSHMLVLSMHKCHSRIVEYIPLSVFF